MFNGKIHYFYGHFRYVSHYQRVYEDMKWSEITHTIWLFNIAMENGPFIDGLPGFTYKKMWFSMANC